MTHGPSTPAESITNEFLPPDPATRRASSLLSGGHAIDDLDRHAWEVLYDQHARDILRYLLKLTGLRSVAEELLQEAFTRGMQSGLVGISSPRAWLFRIATNVARDRHRAQARRPTTELTGRERDDRPVFDADVDLVHRTLSAIPFDDAVILLLHFDAGVSRSQIAADEGASDEAIKSRLRRAKERFMAEYFRQQRGG